MLLAHGRRRGATHHNPGPGLPTLTWRSPVPDIPLGASGYDSVDINNPNLVWDAANDRWVMYYTSYDAIPGNGNQDAAIAYADTLDGPWVKDPLNPVYVDADAGAWSQNGGLEKVGDTWVLAYNAVNGGQVWFATSTDLHTWTKLTTSFQGMDPFLRINQASGALECYFAAYLGGKRAVYRRSSTDAGLTWGDSALVLPPAYHLPETKLNGGEPSVFVPPGKEGEVMMVIVDYYPNDSLAAGRGSLLAVTKDGGATWEWHENYWEKSGLPRWDGGAVFDSFMAYENGKFYLYYAGAPGVDTGTLNMGIQIGHAWGYWDPASLYAQG